MPFRQDTAWSAGLLTISERARAKNTFENRYYGPYDKLLNYHFGESFQFFVVFVTFDKDGKPVLQDDRWARKAELRYRADRCASITR